MSERTKLSRSEGAMSPLPTTPPQVEAQTIRVLDVDEVDKMRDIDRAEVIRTGYRVEDGRLVRMDVHWDDGGWIDGDGEHSYGAMIRGTRRYLALDGTAFGAFDGDRLVGLAVYRPRLCPTMGQLAGLHVSNGYRRQGIASRLFEEVLTLARADGATRLYASATPSGSAVGFYLHHGFVPTDEPDPALFEEEPDDIHMVLELQKVSAGDAGGSDIASCPRQVES